MVKGKKGNEIWWVIGIAVALILLGNQQGFMGAVVCTSNEPITLEGFKSELDK